MDEGTLHMALTAECWQHQKDKVQPIGRINAKMAGNALGIDSQNADGMSFADLRLHKIKRTKRDLVRSHADRNVNGIVYENEYPIPVRFDACPNYGHHDTEHDLKYYAIGKAMFACEHRAKS